MIATTAVTLIPLASIWGLRSADIAHSPWVCIPLAVVISLAVSAIGSAYWKRRRPASELLFSELMLWSWLRHRRSEHTLRDARKLLGNVNLSPERREQLLRHVVTAIEAQDPYTVGHSHRVARHSVMVARKLGLSGEETRELRTAAAIHDVGKLHVSPEILHKPSMLSDAEYEQIKHHSIDGAELVAALGDDRLTAIVRHHHERLDGTGYPSGLAGAAIPLGARIVAVADTFDAITSSRPYRPARAHKHALEILRSESGRQLDGRVVEAFIACYAGRRAIAAWATLSSLPQAAFARLGPGGSSSQARLSPQSALTSTAAVAAVAGVALATPIASRHHRHVSPPPAPRVLAAAPVLGATKVNAAHVTHPRRPAGSSPFSRVLTAPAPPAPAPSVHRQLAVAHVLSPSPDPRAKRAPSPHVTPILPPATFPTAPPPTRTTTTTPAAAPAVPAAPTATSTTTTTTAPVSTTTTTTASTTTTTAPPSTTSTTTSSTSSTTGDRCKDGGYRGLGYPNQGGCESSGHRHHGEHDH